MHKDFLSQLDLSEENLTSGLISNQVKERLQQYGPNRLSEKKENTALKIFFKQFKSFIIIVLLAAALISFLANEDINFYVISFVIFMVIILGFIQEYRAEQSLDALKKLIKPTTTVIRNGEKIEIEADQLVPGDLLTLEAGDRVPADAILLEANSIKVDESTLTGESLPVEKRNQEEIYASTQVVYGVGTAIVLSTGQNTEIGKIADAVQNREEETPLQKKINKMTKGLAVFGFITSIFAALIGLMTGADTHEVLILALTLSVATIPEGLPLTLTITLMHGTRKLAKNNALIRKLVGVETLGSATYICTDKTGTLTENKMNVRKVFFGGVELEIEGSGYEIVQQQEKPQHALFDLFLQAGALNNNASLNKEAGEVNVVGDPTEGAILVLTEKFGLDSNRLHQDHQRLREIFFTSERKMMSSVYEIAGKKYLFSKGATETVLDKSTHILFENTIRNKDEELQRQITLVNEDYANQALRNIAIAYRELPDDIGSIDQMEEEQLEASLTFLGMVAMMDPPKEESKQAVERCQLAGIRVVMITGDNKNTALAIARQVGISTAMDKLSSLDNISNEMREIIQDGVITGAELDEIPDDVFARIVTSISVYARVRPEQKLKIVQALQENGEVVAMTGDGVNDAPALKKADIGIAMGINGTDVSKEAAVMILEDDNFATIVDAVRHGRGIYENIEKFIAYLVSQNFNEIILIILGLLLLGPELLPLTAIQILFINTFDEIIPSLSLGFDKYRDKLMQDKPRPFSEGLLNKRNIALVVSTSIFMAIGSFIAFYISNPAEDIEHARTVTFLSISLMIIFRPFSFKSLKESVFNRSPFDNNLMLVGSLFALLVAVLFIYVPFLEKLIGLEPLAPIEWAIPIITAILSFIWIEISKVGVRKVFG